MFVIILFLHPMSTCTYWQALQQDVFVLQAASEYRSLHINLEAWWRIYVSSNWVITGSGNGLTPARRKVITWSKIYLAIVNWTLEDKLDWNLYQNAKRFFRKNAFEISPAKAIFVLTSVWFYGLCCGGSCCTNFWINTTCNCGSENPFNFTWYVKAFNRLNLSRVNAHWSPSMIPHSWVFICPWHITTTSNISMA